MNASRRNILVEAAAIAGPLAAFVVAKALLAPDPSSARAQPAAVAGAGGTGTRPAGTLSAEQARALAWIKAMPKGEMASPMLHPPASKAQATPEPGTEPDTGATVLSGLRLNGVLGNGESAIATISGKIYRIGDEVRAGIKLRSVDARSGVAELEMADGSVARLTRE